VDPLRQASHHRFDVRDQADAGALRRQVCDQARRMGAASQGCARAELVATELATNLVQHAGAGGWVLTRPLPPAGLELIAVDSGPGIADPAAAMTGRTRTPSGLGCGLASVRRASSHFDLHSEVGRGTIVLAVVDLTARGEAGCGPARRWAGVSVGITEPCGDGWAVIPGDQGFTVAVADGLGHGAAASVAADAATAGVAAAGGDPGNFVARANTVMQGTRGGAATVCQLQPGQGILRYVAIGNVNGCVLAGPARHRLITYSGTLGLRAAPPSAPVLTCPWPPAATLVVWTDGLHSQTACGGLDPGLLGHDPAVIAAALYRDHLRGGDDATVVVARNEQT
jgi:anti-sigma regulatory factor (Ser/Thr protein kinase)